MARPEYRRMRVAQLVPDERNPRRHGERDVAFVRESIQRFDQVEPLLVQKGTRRIIHGHGRYEALKAAGVKMADVAVLDVDDETARRLAITLNRSAELSAWDTQTLDSLVAELGVPEDFGFSGEELAALATAEEIAGTNGAEAKPDPGAQVDKAAELKRKWKTKLGQTWVIPGKAGEHRLISGDANSVLAALDVTVDCVLTDPPYSSGGQFRGDRNRRTTDKYVQTGSENTQRAEFTGDTKDQRAFLAWASMWLGDSLRLAKPGAVALIFTDWRQLPIVTDAIQAGGWVWHNIVTWWKPGIRMQRGRFSSSAEYVTYASNGVPEPGEHSPQNVLQHAPVKGAEKHHIAEKPAALIAELLGVTVRRAIVLDPFLGSGTTMVAAEQLSRVCYGIEIEPKCVAVALERMAGMGLEPRLEK